MVGGGSLWGDLHPPPTSNSRRRATVARLSASEVKDGDSEAALKEKSGFEDPPRTRRTARNLPNVSWVRGISGSLHPPHTYLTLLPPHLYGDSLGASLANYTKGRARGEDDRASSSRSYDGKGTTPRRRPPPPTTTDRHQG